MQTEKGAVVVGAAGFVGQNLLVRLVDAGYGRLVLVDKQPIPPELLRNMKALGADVDTILGALSLDSLSLFKGTDVAICVAGATSVDAGLAEPYSVGLNNTELAITFGELLRITKLRGLYLSSDEVLGETTIPLKPTSPLRPTQPYAASKAAGEIILHNLTKVYGLELITVRACNLVGPLQTPPKLLPIVVQSLVRGNPVPIHGSGEQRREWMHVSDLCEAVIAVLDRGQGRSIYHASTEQSLTVFEVVRRACDLLGSYPGIEFTPDRIVQDSGYAMDSAGLRDLGWVPLPAVAALDRAIKELSNLA